MWWNEIYIDRNISWQIRSFIKTLIFGKLLLNIYNNSLDMHYACKWTFNCFIWKNCGLNELVHAMNLYCEHLCSNWSKSISVFVKSLHTCSSVRGFTRTALSELINTLTRPFLYNLKSIRIKSSFLILHVTKFLMNY